MIQIVIAILLLTITSILFFISLMKENMEKYALIAGIIACAYGCIMVLISFNIIGFIIYFAFAYELFSTYKKLGAQKAST